MEILDAIGRLFFTICILIAPAGFALVYYHHNKKIAPCWIIIYLLVGLIILGLLAITGMIIDILAITGMIIDILD